SRMEPRSTQRCLLGGWPVEARREEVQSWTAGFPQLHSSIRADGVRFHAGRAHRQTLLSGSQGRTGKRCRGEKMTVDAKSVPSISVSYARNGASTKANALGMRPMQERAYEKRGEQYLLIKSPPASGKSRALMFIALDKLQNQGLKQAIIVVPEKA